MPPVDIPPAYRLQAEPLAWGERVVAEELRPVRHSLWRRYHVLTEERLSGERPNAALNARFCEADVHWRLLAADGRGLELDAGAADRWLDAAGAAALLGGDALLTETLERAPGLATVRTVVDFITSPSLELSRDARGRPAVKHPTGGRAARERDQALGDVRPDLLKRPHFAAGLGWRLRDEELDPADGPDLVWGAWLDAANVGLSNIRGELSLLDLSWSVSGRRKLLPRLYATGSVRSVDEAPDPGRWAVGLLGQLPQDPAWSLRVDRAARVGTDEVTWSLSLRAELGVWMPGRLRPSLAGSPAIAPGGPLRLTSASGARR